MRKNSKLPDASAVAIVGLGLFGWIMFRKYLEYKRLRETEAFIKEGGQDYTQSVINPKQP